MSGEAVDARGGAFEERAIFVGQRGGGGGEASSIDVQRRAGSDITEALGVFPQRRLATVPHVVDDRARRVEGGRVHRILQAGLQIFEFDSLHRLSARAPPLSRSVCGLETAEEAMKP